MLTTTTEAIKLSGTLLLESDHREKPYTSQPELSGLVGGYSESWRVYGSFLTSNRKAPMLIRKGKKYSVDQVLELIKEDTEASAPKRQWDGDLVGFTSLRLRVFLNKGVKCITCGLEGSFFAKERHASVKGEAYRAKLSNPPAVSYHMNLYAITAEGHEMLMTHDHTIPSSRGGPNTLENTEPMCFKCNMTKSDKMPERKQS